MRRVGVGIVLLILCSSWYHPIHVSVTNIDLDPVKGHLELSVKIFSDDFQDLIMQKYAVQLRLTEQVGPEQEIDAVNSYIGEALKLEINGQPVEKLNYSRSEIKDVATWFFYTFDFGDRIRKMNIENYIMLEKFEDQTNLVIVAYGDKQNGYRLNNKNTEISFNIK